MNLYLWLLVVVPSAAILRGLTLSILWQWFIVPMGYPALSKAHAMGVALILQCATSDLPKFDTEDPAQKLTIALLVHAVAYLVIGAIIYHFM